MYLLDCFDPVVDADAVASISLDADTALLTNPTLDYGAYAQAAVDAALKAISRDETPTNHHIRV